MCNVADSYEDRIRHRLNNRDKELRSTYLEAHPGLVDDVYELLVQAKKEFYKDTIKIRMEQQQPEYVSDYSREEHDEMIEERMEETGLDEKVREALEDVVDEDWMLHNRWEEYRYRSPDQRAHDRKRLLHGVSTLLKKKDFSYEPAAEPEIVRNDHDDVVAELVAIAEEDGLDATTDPDILYSAVREVFPDRQDYMRACLSLERTKNIIPEFKDLDADPAIGEPVIRLVESVESSFVQMFRPLVEAEADEIYGGGST